MWFFIARSWLYSSDEWVTQVNLCPIAELLWEKNLRPLELLEFLHSLGTKQTLDLNRHLP